MRFRLKVGNVNPETLTPEQVEVRARIRVRLPYLLRCTEALGCDSDVARCRLLDVDPKTLYNARQGRHAVSGDFVAKTLTALRARADILRAAGLEASFDNLFEIAPERAA
jgi:hypothetical protein